MIFLKFHSISQVKDMNKYVAQIKPMWKTYGCTIMCDGWTGPTKLSIINFMVYCKGKTVFLKSVDASDKIKDHMYIYGLMRGVVQSIGSKNVVQIVTDNGSNYKKAGQLLMEKYNLYWTPCAAHCIDLIFERIADKKGVKEVINEGRMITNFIYNHNWLLAQMRAFCGGHIVRPGATQFATNYIALDSLLKKKAGLKTLFTSDEWNEHPLNRTQIGRHVESLILNHTFWARVTKVCGIYEPLYRLLRIVDSEVYPTLGVVYQAFEVMKETLLSSNRNVEWVLKAIKERWDKSIDHPLLSAGIIYTL